MVRSTHLHSRRAGVMTLRWQVFSTLMFRGQPIADSDHDDVEQPEFCRISVNGCKGNIALDLHGERQPMPYFEQTNFSVQCLGLVR